MTDELETARWVDVGEIRHALSGGATQQSGGGTGYGVGVQDGLMLPQASAIANALLTSACEAAEMAAAGD